MNNNPSMKSASGSGMIFGQANTIARETTSVPGPRIDTYILGLVARVICAPMAAGLLLGVLFDSVLSDGHVFAIAFLGIGFLVGCGNARQSVSREHAMRQEEQEDFEY
jgi:hypothetical protein